MARTTLLSQRKETQQKGKWVTTVSVFWNGIDQTDGFEMVVRVGRDVRRVVILPKSSIRTSYESTLEGIKETFADTIIDFNPRVQRLIYSGKEDIRKIRIQLPLDPNRKREPWLSR